MPSRADQRTFIKEKRANDTDEPLRTQARVAAATLSLVASAAAIGAVMALNEHCDHVYLPALQGQATTQHAMAQAQPKPVHT